MDQNCMECMNEAYKHLAAQRSLLFVWVLSTYETNEHDSAYVKLVDFDETLEDCKKIVFIC